MKALKKMIFPVLAVILVISSGSMFGQEKGKSELNKKLAELKGKVEKVTVNVDGKDVVFEGKDAENLVKKMKTPGIATFAVKADGRNMKTKAFTVMGKELEEIAEVEDGDKDVLIDVVEGVEGKEMKKIKIIKEDGDTKVYLTEMDKDGKPFEKVLEGDEAEKYMKENHDGVAVFRTRGFEMPVKVRGFRAKAPRTVILKSDDADDDDSEAVTVWVTKSDKADKAKKEITIKKALKEKKKEDKED